MAGCPVMYSDQPLGEVATLDPKELDGTWLTPERELFGTQVLDSQKGMMIVWKVGKVGETLICYPPEKDLNACSSDPTLCVWRHHGNLFFSDLFNEKPALPNDKPASKDRNSGMQYFRTTAVILTDQKSFAAVYAFVGHAQGDLDKRLRRLVDEGAIPGHIAEDGKVVLGPLQPDHYKRLFDQETGVVRWTDPMPVTKLPDALDPCKKGEQAK